jgi:hypothetical protein
MNFNVSKTYRVFSGESLSCRDDWWTWRDSNSRPLPCHGSALPTAPQAHTDGLRFENITGGAVRGAAVQPLMTPIGLSRATFLAKPALCTTSITSSTSL